MIEAGPDDAAEVFANIEGIKADLRRLETLGKPVCAAINGAALGGGLEITLACHHRIAFDDPRTELGLPEVSLGLLPGGGGVTRITRMLGLYDGLMNVLLTGTRFKPQAAKEQWPRRRARRQPRRPHPGGEGLGAGAPRRRGGRRQPWDRPGYRMPGGTPEQPEARGVPAGVPGEPAQADQGRELPGAAGDHGRCRRGRAGRLRDRDADRVALPDQAGRRAERQEHDPGVLLRPAGDQLRLAAARGRREVPGDQARGARRRDDGRRHRLPGGARRHRGRAQGRLRRERREGQGVLRDRARQADRQGQDVRGAQAGDPRPHPPDRGPGRPGRLRHRDRGGLRGPVAEGEGLRRGAGRREPRRAAVLEHLDAADQRARRRREPPRGLHRHALLLAGRQDAARRDHRGREDLRGDRGARRSTSCSRSRRRRSSSTTAAASTPPGSTARCSPRRPGCSRRASTRRPSSGPRRWPASRRRRWRCSTRCR